MKAFSPVKICILTAFAALLTTGAVARFLVDDVKEDVKPEPPKPAAQAAPAPSPKAENAQSGIPSDYPRNLSVTALSGEKTSIQIAWDATTEAKDPFIVLRSNQIQNTPEAVLSSIQIKVIEADKLKIVIDRNLAPGRYYYAVIPKSKLEAKNFKLFPGDNFSINPLSIYGESDFGEGRTVASIRAAAVEDRSVLITWEPVGSFNGDYLILRSKSAIDTADRMNSSETIGRVSGTKSRFIDNDAVPGRYFYAVVCKNDDGVIYSDLRKGVNYTEDAVFIGGTIGVRGIRAKLDNGNAVISWKMSSDSLNKSFYLIRTEVRPTSRESLAGARIVDTVQSSAEKYTDKNIPEGKFYYVLAPVNYRDTYEFALIGGVNVTDPPVVFVLDQENSPAVQAPEYTRQIERTPVTPPARNPVPTLDDLLIKPEVQERKPEAPAVEKQSPKPDQPQQIEKAKEENKAELKDKPETTEKKNTAPAIKNGTKSPKAPQRKTFSADAVITGPFARGDYSAAINLLKSVINANPYSTDAAKAKLFIARSYIELGKYKDALGYLKESDVKKLFPHESGFWEDYSINRLR